MLVAATTRRAATLVTWEALAGSAPDEPVDIFHVSAANDWAVDVGMEARLELHPYGYLALRHMQPPRPYLHHVSLL